MTLNGVMAVALRYLIDFRKPAFKHITASISGGIYARVYCILSCVYDVVVTKVHEFLVYVLFITESQTDTANHVTFSNEKFIK